MHCAFCFPVTIESTGALPPEVLFTKAVKILEEKCEWILSEILWVENVCQRIHFMHLENQYHQFQNNQNGKDSSYNEYFLPGDI